MFRIYNERYSDFNSLIERYEREMREAYGLRRKISDSAPQEQNTVAVQSAAIENSAPQAEPAGESGTGDPAAAPENETFETPAPPELLPVPFPNEPPASPGESGEPEPAAEDKTGDRDGYTLEPTEENGENETASAGDGSTERSELSPDTGTILVITSSGRDAFPVAGATVVIDRLDENDQSARQELIAVRRTDRSGRIDPVEVKTVSRSLSQSPGDMGPFVTYYISVKHPGYSPVINRPVDVFGGETSILELGLVPLPEDLYGGGANG